MTTRLLQILHGLTFGAAHLGAVHYISETIPENFSATAQGIYSAYRTGRGRVVTSEAPIFLVLC